MMNRLKKWALTSLVGVWLVGCGGEPTYEDVIICQAINNSTYVSEDLFEVGRSTTTGHWQLDLKDYQIRSFQSDFVLTGSYACAFGDVTAKLQSTGDQAMVFSQDYKTLQFAPLGGDPIKYVRVSERPDASASCEAVSGNSYRTEDLSANATSSKLIAPGSGYFEFMTFAEDGGLQYTIGGDAIATGRYDCALGVLSLYANDKKFAEVDVAKNGKKIDVKQDDVDRTYYLQEQTVCTAQFDPVCAVKPQNIQCLVAPCPVGVHQTYSNQCQADKDDAKTLFEGECGKLEGKPYFEPTACTKEYAPVCGGVTLREPCGTIPCPSIVHKTFSNDCMLKAENAIPLFKGECGKLEDTPVTERKDVACPAIFDPVCGKDEAGIVCITTPCPSHAYTTFGNACSAGVALATVVKEGECGSLEDQFAFGEPPVQLVDGFPSDTQFASASKASITDDVLTVTLNYGACGAQHHNMLVQRAFLESNPVQAEVKFQPVIQEFCKASITTEFKYDLLPLKHEYMNAYQTKTGEIILRGLGVTYTF